jgi:hypothetical protein
MSSTQGASASGKYAELNGMTGAKPFGSGLGSGQPSATLSAMAEEFQLLSIVEPTLLSKSICLEGGMIYFRAYALRWCAHEHGFALMAPVVCAHK